MENEEVKTEEKKEVEVKGGSIDKDVLQIMSQEDVLKAISDDTQIKRVILNCVCELYGEIKNMNNAFEEMMKIVALCSADQLSDFFKGVQEGVKAETARINVQNQIEKSHKKPKKTSKSAKNGTSAKNVVKINKKSAKKV